MDKTERTNRISKDHLPDGLADPRVALVVAFFKKDLSQRVSIGELSASVRLSPSGLRRLFRQQMGCSIGRWQRNERLRAACALLCSSCLSVKEINTAVGYNDVSHFVRDFEFAFGLSPKRFRRAHFDTYAALRTEKPTKC